MKLINNFVCGVQAASLAEAIALIERTGLDRDKAIAVLTNGAPGSPLFKAISARMIAADYTPNFKLELMAKDLRYARHEGEAVSLDLKTASAALGIFDKAIAAGEAEKDFSAIIEQLRKH
jgi:3-hydroxyisobutyrate dehydrogenase